MSSLCTFKEVASAGTKGYVGMGIAFFLYFWLLEAEAEGFTVRSLPPLPSDVGPRMGFPGLFESVELLPW